MAKKTKTSARKSKTVKKAARRARPNRAMQILAVLAKKGSADMATIVASCSRDPENEYKFYASTALRLWDRDLVDRKEVGGVWVYRLRAEGRDRLKKAA